MLVFEHVDELDGCGEREEREEEEDEEEKKMREIIMRRDWGWPVPSYSYSVVDGRRE